MEIIYGVTTHSASNYGLQSPYKLFNQRTCKNKKPRYFCIEVFCEILFMLHNHHKHSNFISTPIVVNHLDDELKCLLCLNVCSIFKFRLYIYVFRYYYILLFSGFVLLFLYIFLKKSFFSKKVLKFFDV